MGLIKAAIILGAGGYAINKFSKSVSLTIHIILKLSNTHQIPGRRSWLWLQTPQSKP